MNNICSKFITFEGPEGSGKSTQAAMLAEALKKKSIDAVYTREPGGTEAAEEIRNLLVKGSSNKWDGVSELLLIFAARRHHVINFILPNLKLNKWVICDRFLDSTFAYQGYGHELGEEIVTAVKNLSIGNFIQDLTVVLDIDVKEGIERSYSRKEEEVRYESMDFNFHRKVRDYFMDIKKRGDNRYYFPDNTKDIENIHQDILKFIEKKYGI